MSAVSYRCAAYLTTVFRSRLSSARWNASRTLSATMAASPTRERITWALAHASTRARCRKRAAQPKLSSTPAARQQRESSIGLGLLDDLKRDAVCLHRGLQMTILHCSRHWGRAWRASVGFSSRLPAMSPSTVQVIIALFHNRLSGLNYSGLRDC